MIRRLVLAAIVLVFVVEYLVWRGTSLPRSGHAKDSSEVLPDSIVRLPVTDPGVSWRAPRTWIEAPARPMRLATYRPYAGDTGDAAECAVFYFGPGAGGGVDDNVDRWAAQFVGAPNPKRTRLRAGGMDVTRVEIAGTYLSPGDDMRSRGQRPDWKLLGAIVQGPRGAVFFKLIGPAAQVAAKAAEFDAMLATLSTP